MDFNKAESAFQNYLKGYNWEDSKINLKIEHTYGVVKLSEYITKDLRLDEEDIQLARIIALLHDIGRFEQIKVYGAFEDYRTMDHADYGVKILFEEGLIRRFIEEKQYDEIILKAIKNHNKYEIEEGLSEKELLHSKIIRDADKTDNFRVKSVSDVEDMGNMTESELITQTITDEIFNDFMSYKTIVSNRRKTAVDMWISCIAFIFDYNFNSGLKYIKEKDYINILVDRFAFQNEETKNRMEVIRKCANDYIIERISNNS